MHLAPGTEGAMIKNSCQFAGRLFLSLSRLHGGLARCVSCSLGRRGGERGFQLASTLGWLQCCHGLSPRPLETCMPGCLDPLLTLFVYPHGSITAFFLMATCALDIALPPFAMQLPPWRVDSGLSIPNFRHPFLQAVDASPLIP